MNLKENESNTLPIPENKGDSIENEIKEHLKNKTQIDKDHLNNWKTVEINIAILGDDAANLTKNFIIKKLSGSYENQIDKSDIQIAELNAEASLKNPISFAHSNNNKFQVWDLGTINQIDIKELNSLLSSKEFEDELKKYDFFILLTKQSENLSENESLFADKIESLNKKIYFVKSIEEKLEVETQTDEKKEQDQLKKEKPFQETENKETTKPISDKKTLYLLSNDESKSNYQFLKLNEDILNDLEKNDKFTSYVLTIEPISETIIRKKTEILRLRAYQIAILSSIFGYFLPLPGLTIAADLTLLAGEIIFYLKQFHLNKESIDKMTKKFKNAHYDLTKILATSKYASLLLLEDIHAISGLLLKTIPLFAISSAVDLFKFIPIMGYLLKGTVSYETTKYTLMNILDEFSRVAADVHNFIRDQNAMEKKYAHLIDRAKPAIKKT